MLIQYSDELPLTKVSTMSRFMPATLDNAPEGSRATLAQVNNNYGFVPNLLGTFAHSPEALEGYLALGELLARTDFDATEQQVLLLTISRENGCEYCVAAHSTVAAGQNVPAAVIDAVRDGETIAEPRLEALSRFATAVVEQRGRVSPNQLEAFIDAGFAERQVLDIILATAMKTLSNYTNHLARTDLDSPFEARRWSVGQRRAA
jgi:uncharacterized peroxidase-related enzyme